MKVLFGFQDLAENATEVQRTAHKELKKKDYKALFLIHQCVDPAIFLKSFRCNFCEVSMG